MSRHWPKVRLGEVLQPVARSEAVDAAKEYRLLGVRLDGQGPFLRETVTGAQTSASKLSRVAAGDFIYSRLFAWRGAFGIIAPELDGCYVSGEFPTFLPAYERLDIRFLRYWFTLPKTLAFVDENCSGSTPLTRNRFKEEYFLALEIPLPPLAEQRRIVTRIEELAAQIHEARMLRTQATKETETVVNARLRAAADSLTRRYGKASLEKLIDNAGYGTSTKCSLERSDGAVPVLRIPNVASERVVLKDLKYGRLPEGELPRLLLMPGDILVVRTNGSLDLVGRSAVVGDLPEPTAFASYMIRLRFNQADVDPFYAQAMLCRLRVDGALVDLARTTAGQYNVSLGRLRSAEIPVPTIAEQRRIVAELDALQAEVDALKRHQRDTAAELDALLPAILDRAFRGEL